MKITTHPYSLPHSASASHITLIKTPYLSSSLCWNPNVMSLIPGPACSKALVALRRIHWPHHCQHKLLDWTGIFLFVSWWCSTSMFAYIIKSRKDNENNPIPDLMASEDTFEQFQQCLHLHSIFYPQDPRKLCRLACSTSIICQPPLKCSYALPVAEYSIQGFY